jgi:hypothetical protein
VVFATCPPQIGTTSTQFPVGAISGSRDGGNYEADHFFRAASRRRAMPSPASENTQRPRTPSEPCWPRSVIDWDADFLLKWPMWLDWTRGRSRRARSSQTPPSAYGGTSCVKPIHSCADPWRALIPRPFPITRSGAPRAGGSGP